ncbi:MAG TPA: methyltransferase [Tepidisphaeraceae bacterium]|jgi:ubiquinone/menaquinone biosynthesis C-methylase UbiE|nr:methyltransferase [Tepidisphaeraceae bacterium]
MQDSAAHVTPQRIMGMVWGFAAPLTLEAAVKHRVFDTLDERAKTLDEIARDTGASRRGLRAILNTLVALELLGKQGEKYSLTPESSAFLVSTKPGFQGAILRHISSQLLPAWLKLSDIVRTGKPAAAVNQEGSGAEFFAEFVESIAPLSAPAANMLADHLISATTAPATVLDLAAGSGVWGIAMAKKSPQVSVTAVDWAGVIPVTRRMAQKHGVVDRFKFVEGDLKDADFGTGHTLATLGQILHSEGESRSRALLKKVFAALKPGGTIAIAEFIPDDDRRGPIMPVMFAVNMLVNTDEGDTYTYPEMTGWLREAGFGNVRQLKTPGVSPLILADKA